MKENSFITDYGRAEFLFLLLLQAVNNVNKIIAPALVGKVINQSHHCFIFQRSLWFRDDEYPSQTNNMNLLSLGKKLGKNRGTCLSFGACLLEVKLLVCFLEMQDPTDQAGIDNYMVHDLDGTQNEWGWPKAKVLLLCQGLQKEMGMVYLDQK